jgi:hypothetical protein
MTIWSTTSGSTESGDKKDYSYRVAELVNGVMATAIPAPHYDVPAR